ncbi:MAG: hypothetical protein FWC50_06995 [Planctomycetaceae bacterium]|nr:hypothetical protein [Planctomycetaceae bacterium]
MTSFLRVLTFFFCCFLTCSVLFAEEKYPEFTLPDKSDRKEFEKKLNELFDLLRPTTWGSFKHEFPTDTEKDAYRRRLYAEIIKGYDDLMDARYGITGIPQMILIGRDGEVISIEARGETLEKELAELFPNEKNTNNR